MKLIRWLESIESTLTSLALFVLVVAGFITVICRYILKMSLAEFEDIMLLCFVWVIYLGADIAYKKDKFPKLELLVDSFPDKPRFWFTALSYIISLVASILLTYAGILSNTTMIKRGTASIVTGIPYWTMAIAVPICLFFISIRILVRLVLFMSKGPQPKKPETLEDIQE